MAVKGILYIISAPSGAGKTTLFKMALEKINGITPSISCTTRPKRGNEVEGVDYFFVTDDKFDEMIRDNKFIEWAKVHKHRYGTPRGFIESSIKEGKDILFDIDVQGAKSLKKQFSDAVLTFVIPPSFKILKDRLTHRNTERPEEMQVRLDSTMREIRDAKGFDYLIINDDIDEAFDDLKSVIRAERLKRKEKNFDFDKFIDN
jgi:guanylate kinase